MTAARMLIYRHRLLAKRMLALSTRLLPARVSSRLRNVAEQVAFRRAQDIVRCLSEEFDFECFCTFGGAIMPFVERRIGFNFDPANAADVAFIDRIADIDDQAIDAGHYPASNMIAVLRPKGRVRKPHFSPVSPQQHIDLTRQQQLAIGGH